MAAGNPIVAFDQPEPARLHDFDSFSERFDAPPDWFVRVEGSSLDRLGYRSGDVLAVKRDPDPRNGDIVVARIGDEVVVKRFRRTGPKTIELHPESHNPDHKPMRVTPNTVDFEIVGTVVGAIVGTRRESGRLSPDTIRGTEGPAPWAGKDRATPRTGPNGACASACQAARPASSCSPRMPRRPSSSQTAW